MYSSQQCNLRGLLWIGDIWHCHLFSHNTISHLIRPQMVDLNHTFYWSEEKYLIATNSGPNWSRFSSTFGVGIFLARKDFVSVNNFTGNNHIHSRAFRNCFRHFQQYLNTFFGLDYIFDSLLGLVNILNFILNFFKVLFIDRSKSNIESGAFGKENRKSRENNIASFVLRRTLIFEIFQVFFKVVFNFFKW